MRLSAVLETDGVVVREREGPAIVNRLAPDIETALGTDC